MNDTTLLQTQRSQQMRSILAIAGGISFFFAFTTIWKWGANHFGLATFVSHCLMLIVMAAVSVALAWSTGISVKAMGFRRSENRSPKLLFWYAILLSASATFVIVATKSSGIPMMKSMAFWQIIVSVWLLSSICEEIYVRGFWQSWINVDNNQPWTHPSVIASAIIFGGMHLRLITAGADLTTVATIVTFTSLLGYLCAVARRSSGSIYPAILVHIAFNIGGLLGGILIVICFGIPK